MRRQHTKTPSVSTLAIATVKSIDAIYNDGHKTEAVNKIREVFEDLLLEAQMSGDVSENLTNSIEAFCDNLDGQAKLRVDGK